MVLSILIVNKSVLNEYAIIKYCYVLCYLAQIAGSKLINF